MTSLHVFTPRLPNGERATLQLNDTDHALTGAEWKRRVAVTVTDQWSGQRYTVRRAACGLGCYCDAVVLKCEDAPQA